MNLRVGRVVELAGQNGARGLLDDFGGLGVGTRNSISTGGEHELGTQQTNDGATLLGHGLGHGDDDLVAASSTDEGQADAGVARGGLDDGAAGLELSGCLGRVNDRRSLTLEAGL